MTNISGTLICPTGAGRKLNALLFLTIFAIAVSYSAAADTAGGGRSTYAKTIDNGIECDQVVRSALKLKEKDGTFFNRLRFFCVVNPTYTPNLTKHIRLELRNLAPSFEDEWKKANVAGMPRLHAREVVVEGTKLKLPSSLPPKDTAPDNFDVGESGRKLFVTPLLTWKEKSSTDDVSGQRDHSNSRKLATNQFGTRSVLVFRVTTSTNGSPTQTASQISEGVFGTNGIDTVTLSSMYTACSYNQLNFEPASVVVSDLTYSAPGVMDINISTSSSDLDTDIQNIVKIALGSNDSILDQVDHVKYVLPSGIADSDSDTGWVAFADFPGKHGTYNNERITDVQTLMHETGHNIGLAHSNVGNQEYEDTSGYMGYTNGNGNARKCFNAAKMFELGWYTPRDFSFSAAQTEEFVGKLIGVNDYGISDSTHTLVVEIVSPVADVNSYFLTYNKQEGMNSETSTGANEVRIVQGGPSEKSLLVASITPGSSYTFNNFYNGRDLVIATSAEFQDGEVQYIPLTIAQENISCSNDADCSVNLSTCAIGTCLAGTCQFSNESDCCGNNICDAAENCSTCSVDCALTTHCDEIDGKPDNDVGGSFSSSVFGIKFDVIVTKDVSFYEIQAELLSNGSAGIPAKVYTKVGSYVDNNDLSNWDLIFDGTSSAPVFYQVTMTFNDNQVSAAGSTRAFYIAYETGAMFYFGDVQVTNEDAEVKIGETVRELSPGSTTIPNTYLSGRSFLGGIKYKYDQTATTSKEPSSLPSVSIQPSNKPSSFPSMSMTPSNVPSILPSMSLLPSVEPSSKPSISMIPSDEPSSHPSVSVVPSIEPSSLPSMSMVPSNEPSYDPSMSMAPSNDPSSLPSMSMVPSDEPSSRPSTSMAPSNEPSYNPSISVAPSDEPSSQPSASTGPSDQPSSQPSASIEPSNDPSSLPSVSIQPSNKPSSFPSMSMTPSNVPSILPSVSLLPSVEPSSKPSTSIEPSSLPSMSMVPSNEPSYDPSMSMAPSNDPSSLPSMSMVPSDEPSSRPSTSITPSNEPSSQPSMDMTPTDIPSMLPSVQPSELQTSIPSTIASVDYKKACSDESKLAFAGKHGKCKKLQKNEKKIDKYCKHGSNAEAICVYTCEGFCSALKKTKNNKSNKPSSHPSVSVVPSIEPSSLPSMSIAPSNDPSSLPSMSMAPSDEPSSRPSISMVPSNEPSSQPSMDMTPTDIPSMLPSVQLSELQTSIPSTTAFLDYKKACSDESKLAFAGKHLKCKELQKNEKKIDKYCTHGSNAKAICVYTCEGFCSASKKTKNKKSF